MNLTLLRKLTAVVVALWCMLLSNALQAQTSAISIKAGTTSTANNPGSTGSWANATEVQTENNVFATALITGSNKATNYLDATNWGFQSTNAAAANYIPPTATINGIQVSVKRRKTLAGAVRDYKVILLKAGSEAGATRATTTSWPVTSSFAAYGNEIDLWGVTSFTAADLTNSGFGVRIAARNKGKKNAQAEIDYIKITVYFNQTIYYSKSTGNLETLATWGTAGDGTGTAPLNFTRDGQLFILTNRTSATLTGNVTISGLNSGFVIGNGTTATTLTIPSNFALTANVNLKDNSSLIISNTSVPTLTSIGAGTTVTYNASADQTIADATYYNLSLSGSGNKLFTTNTAAATFIDNSLAITGGVTADNRGNAVVVGGGGISNNGYASGTGSYVYSITDVIGTLSGNGTYDNLEIDATSSSNSVYAVTLGNSTQIKGSLYLNNGSLINGANLTMDPSSVIKVEEGTLANALTSTGYNVTYLASTNNAITTGNELSGTVKDLNVQVASTATLTLNRNVSMTGSLTISSGALDVSNSNYDISLGGNLTNNGTLNLRSNTVTLNGNGVQTINSSSAQTFTNLTVNNATGGSIQLNKPVIVNNALTLTNGLVSTSATNTLTMAATATISGGNGASYINGPLNMTVNSINATKTFPVGKNGAYRPVTLSVVQNATSATVYTAEVIAGVPPTRSFATGIQNVSSVRYYTVSASNAANINNATINLSYNMDDQVLDPSALRVAKSNGTQWANMGGSGTAANSGTITSSTFNSLGDFVLANVNVVALPLTWLSFDAAKKGAGIELNWQTAQEVNTKDFIVEKSVDGSLWSPLGTVASKNSAGTNTYTFTDAAPVSVNYYRVKQVDIDGQFTYSKTIRVVFTAPSGDLVVYPTLIKNGTINCSIKDQAILKSNQVMVAIYDLSGKMVYSNKLKPLPVMTFTCTGLPAGQYTVLIGGENNYQQAKVLVQ